MYFIEKNITKLNYNQHTFFLDPKELQEVQSKLKKGTYQIYYPYPDSEKNIMYKTELPKVLLYEIKTKIPLRHQDIMGTLFSLNIAKELFGDIIIHQNHYYIYILPIIRNYFESNFLIIKNHPIELEEIPLESLDDYQRNYESIELIVSSTRIDTVVSTLCHTNRNKIKEMINKKEIFYNYDYLKEPSIKLKEMDTFSIKKIGKFKYKGILKSTKGNHLIIEILKYI